MKTLVLVASLALVLLSGCTHAPPPRQAALPDASWITPRQAVMLAADAAPKGVEGTFAVTVQATGADRGRTYLNSELDYRDQRNLTVVLMPHATRQLTERLGVHPQVGLMGKDLLVRGEATREKIVFLIDGRPSGKYYYQTHVRVMDADQVTVR